MAAIWTDCNTSSYSTWIDWAQTAASTTSTYYYGKYGSDIERAWLESQARARKPLIKGETYKLPDGGKLIIDLDGNYRVDDSDAKVVYQANRIRDFSPYLNASDMLAKFVEYVGTLGVRRDDVLHLPIRLFVSWLVIEAAERDGDELPEDITPVPEDRALVEVVKPRCLYCGRYVRRIHARYRFPFCNPLHANSHLERLAT